MQTPEWPNDQLYLTKDTNEDLDSSSPFDKMPWNKSIMHWCSVHYICQPQELLEKYVNIGIHLFYICLWLNTNVLGQDDNGNDDYDDESISTVAIIMFCHCSANTLAWSENPFTKEQNTQNTLMIIRFLKYLQTAVSPAEISFNFLLCFVKIGRALDQKITPIWSKKEIESINIEAE